MNRNITAFLCLGGNLADPLAAFRLARQELLNQPAISDCLSSPLYQTPAVGGPEGQPDYLNAVLQLTTSLSAQELLHLCQALEHAAGRERKVRWGARTLDIDLLLFGQRQIQTPELEVPHPRMTERRFVLEPLVALTPEYRHPVSGLRVKEHLERLPPVTDIQLLQHSW